jgi:hypothetical protein
MRAKGSRSGYIIQVRFFLMATFKIAQQFQGIFKICAGISPAVLRFRAGSLDVLAMLLHQISFPSGSLDWS